jgi:hypothetical protein
MKIDFVELKVLLILSKKEFCQKKEFVKKEFCRTPECNELQPFS